MLKKTLSIARTPSALVAVAIFFLAGMVVWPQAQPPATYQPILVSYNGTPFGTCTVDQVALNTTNGGFSSCNPLTHTWVGALSNSLPLSLNGGGFTHTLTGTLTAPRTWTLQDASDTFVFRSTTDTLANKSFSTQIISTVSTGTAPFSISSTTVVPNLNAQLLNGQTAPSSAIVGINDTQTLTAKTLTSPTITTPTLDGTSAAHAAGQVSAVTNFGTALTSQTIVSSLTSTGMVSLSFNLVQVTAGVGCSASTNNVTINLVTFTTQGGTQLTFNPSAQLNITGNGAVDNGEPGSGVAGFNDVTTFVAKSGTSLSYTTTSTLASTGCTTTPQYTIFAKAIF